MTEQRMKHQHESKSQDSLWEGDMREDNVFSSRHYPRRKSAPNNSVDDEEPHHPDQQLTPVTKRRTSRSQTAPKRLRRRDLVRSRHDSFDVTIASAPKLSAARDSMMRGRSFSAVGNSRSPERNSSNMQHSPLHHFVNPLPSPGRHGSSDNNRSLRDSLREGKRQLLHILNSQEGTAYDIKKGFNKRYGSDPEDVSTASTSRSNSSSSEGQHHLSPREYAATKAAAAKVAASLDPDEALEICSRQIRLELRQAEMLELASEAERAAASGQKRFMGRASTFGDESADLENAVTNALRQGEVVPFSQRKVRRSMNFGTPLGRRYRSTPSKISVVALRDVAEVVPVFKDFHLHLRTHFLRRQVDENTLMFAETEAAPASQPAVGARGPIDKNSIENNEDNNMMHMWSTFNFGSWTSTSHRCMMEDKMKNEKLKTTRDTSSTTERKSGKIDNNGVDEEDSTVGINADPSTDIDASADLDVGDMLSGHSLTLLKGPRRSSRHRLVEVPPGLSLLDVDSFREQPQEQAIDETLVADADSVNAEVEASPRTPKSSKPAQLESRQTSLTESPSDEQRHQHQVQDGSPHSPIVVDDIGLDENFTPERKSGKIYRGPSPPPGLPVTPKDNFHRVFEKKFTTPKEARLQELMGTRLAMEPSDNVPEDTVLGPSFVTPVRLRDIRDDHILDSDFLSRVPDAPLLGSYGKNSVLADTPTTIGSTKEDFWNTDAGGNQRLHANGSLQANGIRLKQRPSPRIREYGALLHSSFDHVGDRPPLDETFGSERSDNVDAKSKRTVDDYSENLSSSLDEPNSLLSSQTSKFAEYNSPMRKITEAKDQKRVSNTRRHIDPDGEYLSGGEEGDTSPHRLLLQSASVPHPASSKNGDQYYSEHSAIARGKSYDAHRTAGERTIEDAKFGSIRHRAKAYGGAVPALEGSRSLPRPLYSEGRVGQSNNTDAHDTHHDSIVESSKGEAVRTKHLPPVKATASQNGDSLVVIDFNGMDTIKLEEGSVADDSRRAGSKDTADFQCECLMSPASSLDSEDGLKERKESGPFRATTDFSNWNLMDKSSMPMFSHSPPTSPSRRFGNVVYAPSKENDAFVSNYLYCGKTSEVEVPPDPEPICSGSAPCQDANMPCGQIAVDSCIGNFLDNTLKFLPRKTPESKKQLSLSRDGLKEPQRSKSATWYDVANEKFDLLLENFIGNDHKTGEHSRLAYEAPALKERKTPEPLQTPPRNSERVYDEDFGGVVYVPSFGSMDTNASHSSSQVSQSVHSTGVQSLSETHTRQQQRRHPKKKNRRRQRGQRLEQSRSLASPEPSEYDDLLQQQRRLMVSQHTM